MMNSQILILVAISLPLLGVIIGRLRMDFAALSIMGLLAILQFSGFSVFGPAGQRDLAVRALSGFGQDAVIILICVFILTSALDKSGFARWISRQILKVGGNSIRRLTFLFACTAAILSLFMNDVAAGALLIPSVLEVCRRTKINPGKLLIPVSYGSLLGGMATYFATANILASSLLRSASPPQQPLSVLAFLPTGGLIAISGIAFLTIFGPKLLPDRKQAAVYLDSKPTESELEEAYGLSERTWKVIIPKDSFLIGKELSEIGLGKNYGITLAAVHSENGFTLSPGSDYVVKAGNQWLIIGREERVRELESEPISLHIEPEDEQAGLSKRGLDIFELLVLPHSSVIGKTLKDIDFRNRFGWSVIALQRGNSSYKTDVGKQRLLSGDSLLVIGESARKENVLSERDFLLLEPSTSDKPPRIKETTISLGLLLAAVVAAVAGVPVYIAVLIAALLAIATRMISMQEAYKAIEWQVIIAVGSMYSMTIALVESGLAEKAGAVLVHLTEFFGPLGLAGGSFLIASALSQIMGGQFEMLVTGPIAISAAIQYGINPQAVALAVAIGCSNSFLTPMAHPVNLLMMGPGGYKFSDFVKIGWKVALIAFAGLLVGMVLFWGLY